MKAKKVAQEAMEEQKEKITTDLETIDDIPHIGPVSKKKLISLNITNKRKFYTDLTATRLIEVTAMKRDDADEAMLFVRDELNRAGVIDTKMITAAELRKIQQNEKTFQTGATTLDALFGDGIKAGYITEIYGQNGSGKTQIEITLILDLLIKDKTALVGVIDTEGKLLIKRFSDILMARGLVASEDEADEKYLNRIFILRALTQDQQLAYIDNFSGMLAGGSSIKMIVIDSIISLLQSEFQDRGVMKEKFSIIKPMMQNLRRIAFTYQIPVIVVNTVHLSPTVMFGLDPIIPAGGDSVGHISAYRMKVEKIGGSGKRRATLKKSPADPESEADFIITDKGIENAK